MKFLITKLFQERNRDFKIIILVLFVIFISESISPASKSCPSHTTSTTNKAITQNVRKKLLDTTEIVFYDASNFDVLGKLPNVEKYSRLPQNARNIVRRPVWNLSKHSAGISIRFNTNSSTIKVRWTLLNNPNPVTMTAVVAKGLDLYSYVNNKWQFVGIAKPSSEKHSEALVINGMEVKSREYLLNLPLYAGVSLLEIGVDKDAYIEKPHQKIIDKSNPIVLYGTSITQGSSASRPGLAYASLLQRYFNKNVINLGFSGNGRFEKEIAEYIITASPSIIILDCTPNSGINTIKTNLPKTIDYIRSIDESLPILLVESIMRDYAFFKRDDETVFGTVSFVNEQNRALKEVYESKSRLYNNIYYISNKNLIGQDNEATIDGTHFNDLGHFRAYEQLKCEIEKILLKLSQ